MLASRNAGWIEGAILISEIIHHSVRRTSSSIYVPTRTVFETCVMAYFFYVFFSSFIFLINHQSIPVISRVYVSRCHIEMRFARFTIQKVNEYASWITRFCSSFKTTPHNGSDGRSRSIPSLFTIPSFYSLFSYLRSSPAGPKTSPFQSHSTLLRFSSRCRSR